MVLFGVKEKSKYQHMPEFYVRSKLLKIFIVVVAVESNNRMIKKPLKNLQKYFMIR